MKKITTLFCCSMLIAMFSCTKVTGVDVTEHFDASQYYYRIEVSDGMVVHVSDQVSDIVVTTDEGIMPKIKVATSNGVLRIYRKDFSALYVTKTDVQLPYNQYLEQVTVSYDSEFHANPDYGIQAKKVVVKVNERSKFFGYLCADEIELKVKSRSETDIDFDAYSNMDIKIEESSQAKLDGYAHTVHLEMNDRSTLEKLWHGNYYAFMCYYCYGTMNDNCDAYIDCEDEIRMNLTNHCFMHYTSDPNVRESTIDDTSDFYYEGN